MSDSDAAFLWETEALRASRRRGEVADRPAAPPPPAGPWATLREAHYETGIPIETLRKWARRGAVPSFLNESEVGVRRMVRMEAVRERARVLGRPIAPISRPPDAPRPTPAVPEPPEQAAAPPPEPPAETRPAPAESASAAADPEAGRPDAEADRTAPPEGTMIVPIAAWDKMLMQLGNLHEAGQLLAEARERAAKAETEATFLRERIGEMRQELAASRSSAADGAAASRDPEPAPRPPEAEKTAAAEAPEVEEPAPAPSAQTEKLWRYIYRGWRARRRP